MACHALGPTVRTQIAGFAPSKPIRRYCTTLLTRIFSSVSIPNAPPTHNVQPLSHTVPNNRVQAIFPASRIIQHQYRVSTDPVLWSFFSAHIPEFTGYTNTNCPSEEFGAAQIHRASLACSNFELLEWILPPVKSLSHGQTPIPHGFGPCAWRNSLSNCSACVQQFRT
jgi:hypothetical protein